MKQVLRKIIIISTLTIITVFCENPPPIDIQLPYDTDGDGISNCVENNGANNHHNFNPDQDDFNPSIAHGLPNNGTLGGGINICDNNTGYYHFYGTDPIDTDDWGTLKLIQVIEASGRKWNSNFNFKFGCGDMSLQNGGYFIQHSSHQNGLDMDMRYVRTDRQELPLDISTHSSLYDPSATVALMNIILQESGYIVTHIFVDTNYAQISNSIGSVLQHSPNHSNHFHVRIEDPDGKAN